jgi:hypothetical protein
MLKAWEAQGIHLWTESEAIIPIISGQNEYIIDGTISNDVGGDLAHNTSLTQSASGTSLTVDDATWANVGDYVVVTLDDDSRQTTTITDVSANTLTITDSVSSTASSGNPIIIFTHLLNRPLMISSMRYRYATGIDRPMMKYGRTQFMRLPTKSSSQGPSTVFYYTPQLNSGRLYIWPTPDNSDDMLEISYVRTIEDLDSSADNPDLPQEWLDPITYNLAVRIAPAFGISVSKVSPEILQIAQQGLAELEAWDFEEGSIKITPNRRY